MFFFKAPLLLNSIQIEPSIKELKDAFEILIIDDNPPPMIDTLRRSGFRVRDIKDIETIETTQKYPIIACDIQGIGKSFRPHSENGGFYVLQEIRKYYPDKYLIQYSTKSQDLDAGLTKADVIFPKDTNIEAWQRHLESSLKELGNPKRRWMRIRRQLSDQGEDGYKIYQLEQAYIKGILNQDPQQLKSERLLNTLSPETKKIIINFVASTISMGIKEFLK